MLFLLLSVSSGANTPPVRLFHAAQERILKEAMEDSQRLLPPDNRYLGFLLAIANLPSFPIFLGYLTMVFLSGIYTRCTQPLSLKWMLVAYNAFCVVLSALAMSMLCYGIYDQGNMFEMVHNAYVKEGMYIYYVSKYVELLDTVIMIVRHRHRQVSFLQVYHHSSVLVLGNYAYVYAPWAPIAVLLALNSLVHVFLYAYYGQAVLASGSSPLWKMRLTQLQMAQFVFAMVLCTWGYLHYKFCIYGIFYSVSMFLLFSNFYYYAYIKARPDKPLKHKEQ